MKNPTTTLYVPHPVDTLEQAEALPAGTIVRVPIDGGRDWTVLALSITNDGSRFWFAPMSRNAFQDKAVVGGIALIRTEVEVEHLRETDGRRRAKTLYITDWTEGETR